jgi:hypothetical protein
VQRYAERRTSWALTAYLFLRHIAASIVPRQQLALREFPRSAFLSFDFSISDFPLSVFRTFRIALPTNRKQ